MTIYIVCGYYNPGDCEEIIHLSAFDTRQKADDFIKTDPVLEEDKGLFNRYDRYSVQEFEVL